MEIGECGRGMRILNCIVVCVIGVKEKHIVPWYSAPKKKILGQGLWSNKCHVGSPPIIGNPFMVCLIGMILEEIRLWYVWSE